MLVSRLNRSVSCNRSLASRKASLSLENICAVPQCINLVNWPRTIRRASWCLASEHQELSPLFSARFRVSMNFSFIRSSFWLSALNQSAWFVSECGLVPNQKFKMSLGSIFRVCARFSKAFMYLFLFLDVVKLLLYVTLWNILHIYRMSFERNVCII